MEQKLAGLVSSKIINTKEYIPARNADSSDIKIPIFDVYFTMFDNAVIDIKAMAQEDALETEKEVYGAYLAYKEDIYEKLRFELTQGLTPYKELTKEYQVYQSNIVALLRRNGVIMADAVVSDDATQIAWATDEVISLCEYLKYCISQNWIDVSKLDLDAKYSDSAEIYDKILDYIIVMIDNNTEFQKRFYKYMLLNDVISGRQVCQILCEQNRISIPEDERNAVFEGRMSAY